MATVKPIRTMENNLASINIADGQLIFVTDSQKIYIDKGTERCLCANFSSGGGGASLNLVAGDGISIVTDQAGNTVISVTNLKIEIKNDNWWVNDVDTGVKAKGEDGLTPEISIDPDSKMWIINGSSTGVVAAADTISQSDFQSMIQLLSDINTKVETALKQGV